MLIFVLVFVLVFISLFMILARILSKKCVLFLLFEFVFMFVHCFYCVHVCTNVGVYNSVCVGVCVQNTFEESLVFDFLSRYNVVSASIVIINIFQYLQLNSFDWISFILKVALVYRFIRSLGYYTPPLQAPVEGYLPSATYLGAYRPHDW